LSWLTLGEDRSNLGIPVIAPPSPPSLFTSKLATLQRQLLLPPPSLE
jgi:hypothetical protein